MERQVFETLRSDKMWQPGETILVALSGGADSTALLCCLHRLQIPICACHLNHGLRGAESERDENFVRALCTRLEIPLAVERTDAAAVAHNTGQSIETAARALRYDFFARTAQKFRASRIATAHTADDNLETVLFHLTRGTGLRGLTGIPPMRGQIIRPLLRMTRQQVEDYLEQLGQEHITDSSNASDVYTRNRIRHQIAPVLREINPRVVQAVGRMTEQLRTDNDLLDQMAAELQKSCTHFDLPEGVCIERAVLKKAHPALVGRVLRQTLSDCGLPLSQIGEPHLHGLTRLLEKPGELDLPGGWMAWVEKGELFLAKRPPVWEACSVQEGLNLLPNGRNITIFAPLNRADFNKSFNTLWIDRDTIDFKSLAVRPARAEDRLTLPGSRGARTVRRLCIDRGILPRARQTLLTLTDEQGVIAVERLGVDCSRLGKEKRWIKIEFGG